MKHFFADWLHRRTLPNKEIREELESHIRMRAELNESFGMSKEDAIRAARRTFGNRAAIEDDVRGVYANRHLEMTTQDVHFALRTLIKAPALTAVTLLTLALGIAATTVIFSVVNAVALRPLPYGEPDRLVRIVENVPAAETVLGEAVRKSSMNQDEFAWWRMNSETLSDLAMIVRESQTLVSSEGAIQLTGARVTPTLFSNRRVAPLLGRGLVADEERPDAGVVVLSESVWRRYYGSDPNLVGETVSLDGRLNEVVGVMPSEFGSEDFWTPLFLPPAEPGRVVVASVTARLRDGVSLEAANAEANVLGLQYRGVSPEPDSAPRFEIVRELDEVVAPVAPALRALVVAVGVVLLIVCTNVANLLLVRGVKRQNEIGIRRSLGATRARIIRQMLTESFVLATLAGLIGIAMAYGGSKLVKSLATVALSERFSFGAVILPRLDEIRIDPMMLVFVGGLVVAMSLLFGTLPALRVSRFGEIRNTSKSRGSSSLGNRRLGNVLAVAQISLAMTLLIGAGLLLNSFLRLATVDVGFDAENVLSFDLVISDDYTAERKLELAQSLAERLESHPRIESAGFTDVPPLQPATVNISGRFVPAGFDEAQIAEEESTLPLDQRVQSRNVSGAYLRALRARLVDGRWFDEPGDASDLSAIISRPYARRYFEDRSPVGSTIESRFGQLTIVGVVDDIHLQGLDSEPERIVFLDPAQVLSAQRATVPIRLPQVDRMFLTYGTGTIAFAVRTSDDPLSVMGDIPAIARAIDPGLSVGAAMPMEQVLSGITTRPRFYAVLISAFAGMAAFIAAIGIYGVLAYVVEQRTNEIGIRMALGAERSSVLRLVMAHGAVIVVIGIFAGLAGATWLTQYISGMLFGVTSFDAGTYLAVSAAFAFVALIAAYVPARRATTIDPVSALRYE